MKIRFAELDDACGILAIYAPYCESTSVSFEIVAPTESQMRQRIAALRDDYPWLVCDAAGEVAGYVYACRHRERAAYRWTVDVAVYVAQKYWRRGVGRGLYTSLFKILRAQGYVRAYAGITLPNAGSVGLHESMGFRPVAVFAGEGFKFGQWRDVGWWELPIAPATLDPAEPKPLSSIRESDAVAAALAEGERLLQCR